MDSNLIIRTKVSSLDSARQKLWLVKELLQEWNITENKGKKERILFEMGIAEKELESFKSFQVYKIVIRIHDFIQQLKPENKIENEVLSLMDGLVSNSINQSRTIQNLIEQRIQSEILLKHLDDSHRDGKNNDFFREELPQIEGKQETEVHSYKHNEELLGKYRKTYQEMIEFKNSISQKGNEIDELKECIDKFSFDYDQNELILVNELFKKITFAFENENTETEKILNIKSFISDVRYPRYLLGTFENFLVLFFELMVDYGANSQHSENLELRVTEVSGHLSIAFESSLDFENFMHKLESKSDSRFDDLKGYARFLKIKLISDQKHKQNGKFRIEAPLSLDVHSAYEVTFAGDNYFILESDISSFVSISLDNIYEGPSGLYYSYKGVSIALVTKHTIDSSNIESCVGVLSGTGADRKIYTFDSIKEKKQIVLHSKESKEGQLTFKGICKYHSKEYFVLDLNYGDVEDANQQGNFLLVS